MLPKRHTSAAMQEGVLRSAEVLARAQDERARQTPFGWKLAAFALPAAVIVSVAMKDRGEARGHGGLPFDHSVLVSADLVGLRASAAALERAGGPAAGDETPPRRGVDPDLAAAASPVPTPRPRRSFGGTGVRPQEAHDPPPAVDKGDKKECRRCDLAKLGLEEPTEVLTDYAEAVTVSEEAPRRIPVGTRILVRLADPVTTSAEGAPVTSAVVSDVVVGGQVLVPAGARFEGVGFATEQDDRARVLFTTLVVSGQSLPVQGLGLSPESEVGLEAKVIRKASKGKHGAGVVLRALGAAAGIGLAGHGGAVTSAAGGELGYGLGRELQSATRDWVISDKALRVAAGTAAVVYLRAEVIVP